jgi:hypothetical protein
MFRNEKVQARETLFSPAPYFLLALGAGLFITMAGAALAPGLP